MRKFNCLSAATAICALVTACNDHPLKPAELVSTQEDESTVAVAINKDVDILFVIDNSGSMAEEQATLARNFGSLIEVLEDDDVDANYRVAITTTDDGHLLCNNGNAQAGRFRLSSCQGRSEEFEFNDDNQFDVACAASCSLDNIAITPTVTHLDPDPKPRPWLERIDGRTNLPDGVSTIEAFQCFGPQGINGCGYESHLASMQKALIRATDEGEEAHGFLRPGAILAVIFVTDEADCSARKDGEFTEIWSQNGPQLLWSEENKNSAYPTSEVCWRAGVECIGGPGTYDDCVAANIGVDGNPTDDDSAILFPVSRYVDFLRGIEDQKRMLDDGQRIIVGVIGGVPPGYAEGEADIVYQDSTTDTDFQSQMGIGPGCDTPAGQAAPPVRMLEFADNFYIDRRNMYSVCKDDYTEAMQGIAAAIADRVRPPCVQVCVQDTDPTTLPLEANCRVKESFQDGAGNLQERTIPACIMTVDSFEFPPGAEVCFRALGDKDGSTTPNPFDDMGMECRAEGWNLELALETTDPNGVPATSGITATCLASTQPENQCPNLGQGSDN